MPGDADAFGEVVRRLGYYFNTVFGRTVALLEMAGRLLEAERPDLVLLITEYGRFERATVIGARLRGIPVLALQHGVIHPHHPGYMFSEDEVSATGSVRFPYYPLPDLTAVYGPYDRKLLTEVSAYPPETVAVTGHPRYDLLASAEKWYRRDKVLGPLHLDPARTTVLWATQTHSLREEENRRNVRAVGAAMAELKDAQLVLKLHPGEDQRALFYRRGLGMAHVIVDGKGDTLALLYAADILITRHSTVAMEAIALNRPVVILNLSGEPDPVEYVKEGVAVGVYRQEDLPRALHRLLRDDTPLAEHRKQFIERYLFKIDGRATERVVRHIEAGIGEGSPGGERDESAGDGGE